MNIENGIETQDSGVEDVADTPDGADPAANEGAEAAPKAETGPGTLFEQLNTPENIALAKELGDTPIDIAKMSTAEKLNLFRLMKDVVGVAEAGSAGVEQQQKQIATASAEAERARGEALQAAAAADDLIADPALAAYLQAMRSDAEKQLKDADMTLPTPETIAAMARLEAAKALEGFRKTLEAPRQARVQAAQAAEQARALEAQRTAARELLKRPEFEDDAFFDRFKETWKSFQARGLDMETAFRVTRAEHAEAGAEADKAGARRGVRPGSATGPVVQQFDSEAEENEFLAKHPEITAARLEEARRAARAMTRR